MSFRRRALFLAGLFVAVSCSDAGNPMDPDGPDLPQPGSEPETVLQAIVCDVNIAAGTVECAPPASTGDALGAINIGGGTNSTNGTYIKLTSDNVLSTPTMHSFDVSIKNNMAGQIIGTLDGVTPHPYGMKAFFYDPAFPTLTAPRVTQKINAAQPASISVNGDASQKFTGAGSQVRPYFQYAPQILDPGETSTTKNWSFTLNNVAQYTFVVYVSTEVRHPKGWLNITPDAPIVQAGTNDTLTAQIRGAFGQRILEGVTWSSSNPSIVTVTELAPSDSLAQITGVSEGQAWVKAVSNHPNAAEAAARRDSVLVTVSPQIANDSISALSNVTVYLSADSLSNQTVVDTTYTTAEGGTATVRSDGTLSYLSPAGYAGKDTVTYDVTNGTWRVKGRVIVQVDPSNYWYVQAGADDPGSTEDNTGRDAYPFRTMAAAITAASANDSIFVLAPANGTDPVDGPAVLKAGQAVLGAGISDLYQVVLNDTTVRIFAGTGATPGLTRSTPGATVTAAQNNVIRGVAISASGGAALFGSSFGTLFVRQASVAATGPALDLTTGTVDAELLTLSSTNSTGNGIALNAGGRVSVLGSGSISGAAAAAVSVSGSVKLFYGGSINQASNTPLLNVANHTDSLSLTGTLTASNGTGLQFSNADGTYNITGSATLAGGDAGVDVLAGSDGIFNFANASVTNPSAGPALNVNGGTPALFYRGSITHNTGRAVLVDGITADSVVLRAAITSGTSGTPTGLGILVQNLTGGLVALDSTKSLFTGANPAVTINNPAGSVRFGHAMDITTTTGAGFTASGAGTVSATGANTVATGTGVPVSLTSVNTGTAGVSFSSISTSAGAANGIVLNGILGAGFQATGGTVAGTTGPAVQLTNTNAADSVSLRGMTFSRSAGAGAVISGTSFGKLHVLNTSVTATGGPGALALTTGTMSGTYSTVSSNASTGSGVSLTGVNGTFTASGGSINTAGAAAFLVSGGSVSGTISGTVAQASAVPLLSVSGGHETGANVLTFAGNVTATNGNGLQFDNADGTYTFTANVTLQGGDAGIDITNGSGGDFTFPTTANIVSPTTGNLISILNSAPNFTYSGSLTKANNNVTGILISNNTGGTITFNGDATTADGDPADVARTISSGTAAAVSLVSNGTATINFNGGGLNITSGSGAGFTATGGGTVNVTGAGNQVNANAGGTAVNIQSTTIGAGGVSFLRVDATGAGTNGIVLSSTGAGGFQVTGDGASDPNNTTRGRTTAGSSGPLVLGSGGTISGRSGHGVSLATTGPVILRNMVVQGNASSGDGINAATVARLTVDNTRITGHASDHGILGNGVSGFALHHSEVDNNGTTVGVVEGPDIWNIRLLGLTGTDSIRNSNIHHSQENVLGIINTSGVLNLTVLNTNVTDTGTGAGGTSALMVAANGSSNVTLNLQSDSISRGRSRGLQIGTEAGSSAVLNLTVNNSQFHQNGAAIDVSHGSGGTNTFSITNNNLQAGAGSLQAIIVNRAGSPSFNSFGLFTGTVSGNTIGTAGTASSGSDTSNGIEVESNGSGGIMRVAVVNNTVREVGLHGIYVAAVDANIGGTAPPLLEARVASNTISNMEAVGLDGIHVLPGALNTDDLTMCVDIANNNSTGIRNGLRVRPSGLPAAPSTVQLEGWDGVTAVNTYFTNRPNTLAGGTAAISTTAPPAPGGFSAVANCNTP